METTEAAKGSASGDWKAELKVWLVVLALAVVGSAAVSLYMQGLDWLVGAAARWFTRLMNATGKLTIVDSSVLAVVALLAWQVLCELAKIPGATLRRWRAR